jgi:hypothetical protein
VYHSYTADNRVIAAAFSQNKACWSIHIAASACQHFTDGYLLSNRVQCCSPYFHNDGRALLFDNNGIQPAKGVFLFGNQSITSTSFSKIREIDNQTFHHLYSIAINSDADKS